MTSVVKFGTLCNKLRRSSAVERQVCGDNMAAVTQRVSEDTEVVEGRVGVLVAAGNEVIISEVPQNWNYSSRRPKITASQVNALR